MYTITLGTKTRTYATIEEAWDSHYLDARRGCLCPERGCRCTIFEKFKKRLETYGSVALHAAIVYTGDVAPNLYAIHAKQQKETL